MEIAEVAKTDLSQMKCCVTASQETVQGRQIGEDSFSVVEANFKVFSA
jgi:hypothetical protein